MLIFNILSTIFYNQIYAIPRFSDFIDFNTFNKIENSF